jgi:DNA-binding GntR family transcriptional regulator
MTKLKPLKESSLRVQAARTIRQAIFSGQFQPGTQLLEMHLARDLGVSQTTVREALVQLEQAGLVVRIPNKGTSVTTLTPEEVRHRLTIRTLLEGLAWVAAASRMGPQAFEHLEGLLVRIRGASEISPEKAEAELAFHRYIWEQSGNPTLVRMLDLVTPPLFAFITPMRNQQIKDVKKLDRAHEEVVTALRRNDPEELTATLREHLESSYGKFPEAGNLDFHLLISTAFGSRFSSSDLPTGKVSL